MKYNERGGVWCLSWINCLWRTSLGYVLGEFLPAEWDNEPLSQTNFCGTLPIPQQTELYLTSCLVCDYSGTSLLRHPWDSQKCPDQWGVHISEVELYVAGPPPNSVLIEGVSHFRGCPYRGVPLYIVGWARNRLHLVRAMQKKKKPGYVIIIVCSPLYVAHSICWNKLTFYCIPYMITHRWNMLNSAKGLLYTLFLLMTAFWSCDKSRNCHWKLSYSYDFNSGIRRKRYFQF